MKNTKIKTRKVYGSFYLI